MSGSGLSPGDEFLSKAAQDFFVDLFQISRASISEGTPVTPGLGWVPTFHFRISDHLTFFVEASESPYPQIFSLRRTDVLKINMPVAVYCVCPEEAFLMDQAEAKRLISDGFGLLTVAGDGSVEHRHKSIPLMQQILKQEFLEEIKRLPAPLRTKMAECFDNYNHSPPSGSAAIAEVMEGLVLKAGQAAVKKGWLTNADVKAGLSAKTLSAMVKSSHFTNATAAIGAALGYINMWRNPAHHHPKDARQAAKKLRDCRHSFIEGIKKIDLFREAMKNLGLKTTL